MYHARTSMESSFFEKNEVPSWVVRGHIRKPNWAVRGLYWIFDWLGDFGPMFGALFNSIGRFSLVVVNLVILAGTIVLSAAHSLELLRFAGFTGGLEWVAMVVWELVFIFSSIVLANDFRKGKKGGWAPWAGFLMGFAFVELSNYLGMADNWIGRAIGISTPILLLVSKGLLAHQFKRKPETDNQITNHQMDDLTTENQQKADEQPANKTVESPTKKLVDKQPEKQPIQESTTNQNDDTNQPKFDQPSTEKVVNQPPEKQPEEQPQPTANETTNHQPIEMDEESPEPTTFKPVESMESADNQPVEELQKSPILESEETTKKMVEQPTKIVDEIHQENNEEINHENDQENNHQNNQNFDQNTNQSTNQIPAQTTTKIPGENNQPVNEESTTNQPSKQPTKRKKQLTRKRGNSSTEKMKKAARKWALEFYHQKGELPGRTRVQNGVGCSDYIARQTLEELKEELGIAS